MITMVNFDNRNNDIFETINDLLRGKGINPIRDSNDESMMRFDANVDERIIHCVLVCDMHTDLITFVAYLEDKIPQVLYPEILEFMARINKDIYFGSFQLNFENGKVRCHTVLPMDNAIISYEQLERLFFKNLLHVSKYQSGFSKIINAFVSPVKAWEEIKVSYYFET